MKLFVIGATGRTGKEIAQQALARGHQVTAFVRSPDKIDEYARKPNSGTTSPFVWWGSRKDTENGTDRPGGLFPA